MGNQPESKLSRAIMGALRNRGIWCFKVHGGPFTQAGTPDIIACVPVQIGWSVDADAAHVAGIFVGFETKTPTGGDPSPIQQRQHDKIRAACGHVCVPRSPEDAIAFIEALGYTDPRPPAPDVSTAI